MQELQIWPLDWEDPLEKENSNPLQYSCLGNPMDRGACWAIVQEVKKEQDIKKKKRVGHDLVTKQE